MSVKSVSDVERVGVPQVYPARGYVSGGHEPGVFPHDGGSAGPTVEAQRTLVHPPGPGPVVAFLHVDGSQLSSGGHVDLQHLVLHSPHQEATRPRVVQHAVHVNHAVGGVGVDGDPPPVLGPQ